MPLELGIALYRSTKAKHQVYVFESKAFRAQRSTSDINKLDPRIHNGRPIGVLSALQSLFWQPDRMTVPEMLRSYRAVKAKLPALLRNAGSRSTFEKAVFEGLKVAALVEREAIKKTRNL